MPGKAEPGWLRMAQTVSPTPRCSLDCRQTANRFEEDASLVMRASVGHRHCARSFDETRIAFCASWMFKFKQPGPNLPASSRTLTDVPTMIYRGNSLFWTPREKSWNQGFRMSGDATPFASLCLCGNTFNPRATGRVCPPLNCRSPRPHFSMGGPSLLGLSLLHWPLGLLVAIGADHRSCERWGCTCPKESHVRWTSSQ